MLKINKCLLLCGLVTSVALQSTGGLSQDQDVNVNGRQGRDLLDWIGLGTGPDTDPYLSRINAACLNGDLAECFKSRAFSSLDEFFDKPIYQLTENARVLRMPESQLRQLTREPYEYSESPRADESEWDQLVKFLLRKTERFLKSTMLEVNFNDEVTERGRYSPRFVDEIADEVDLIEDKKDSIFKRKQLKKLIIPLLIVLKLFKLKLLLFLPLILGLASFKKFLGFLAIIIPGLIAYFKLFKPDLHSTFGHGNYYYNTPQYSPTGIAYQPHFNKEHHHPNYQPGFSDAGSYYGAGGVNFRDDSHAQNLAYSGYSHYRSNGAADINAEEGKSSKRKSILPDS